MKTALPVLVLLIIIGAGAAGFAYLRNPHRVACMRVGELCGGNAGTKERLDQCTTEVEQWRKQVGDEPVDKGIQCVDTSKTCAEAMGCIAGASVPAIKNVVDDFLKGFGKATK